MFGSRKTLGAVSIPAIAPSTAARPQPRPSIKGTLTPTRRASAGLTAAARSASPTLVNWKNSQSTIDGREADGDRADVRIGDRDVADLERPAREGALDGAHLARPDPRRKPVEQEQQADRDDHDADLRAALDGANHRLVDPESADERHEQGDRERGPVADAVVRHQRPGDVGGEHRHLALGEVDDAGGAVNEHERQREQAVDAAGGETRDDLLEELRHQ